MRLKTNSHEGERRGLYLSKPLQICLVSCILIVIAFILFRIEGKAFQWELQARDWTGFGKNYDNDVLTVTEITVSPGNKKTQKTITTTKRLQPSKTLWDWMSLLIAPATLAGLGFFVSILTRKSKIREGRS